MINPNAHVEVPASELLEEARQLFREVRVAPDRDRVVSMIDRLNWKINELESDRQVELEANAESVRAVNLEELIDRLTSGRAMLAIATVFHPVELLTDESIATQGELVASPAPDDGNIYVDGEPVAHSTLFDVT